MIAAAATVATIDTTIAVIGTVATIAAAATIAMIDAVTPAIEAVGNTEPSENGFPATGPTPTIDAVTDAGTGPAATTFGPGSASGSHSTVTMATHGVTVVDPLSPVAGG